MEESFKLDPDPTDKLLANHDILSLDKSKEDILLDLDAIWYGEGKSVKDLKRCTKANSRWVLRKTEPIHEHYSMGASLGIPGSYGIVKSCVHKITKERYAVKKIKKWIFEGKKHIMLFFRDLRQEIRLMNEVQDHPSIIKIKRVFESIDVLYIVMNACLGGELFERIQQDNGFSEKKASRVFGDMLSAINYLHSRGIVHCDLKPENFLFKYKSSDVSSTDNVGVIKLIDFGMAKILRWRKYSRRMRGTPYYMAPEVIQGEYNNSCDMWSMGIILFVMVYGFPPFFLRKTTQSTDPLQIYEKITKGFEPKVKPGYGPWFPKAVPVSHDFKDLLARLLRISVAARMTAEEALAHPWITQNSILQTQPLRVIKSLRVFKRSCALKNDILRVLRDCNYLNCNQEWAVRDTFRLIDKDGDGIINAGELLKVIRDIDPEISHGEVKEIIAAANFDGRDNVLKIDDFLSARINRKVVQKEERLRKLFQCLDIDGNGKLSCADICAVMESVPGRRLTEEEAMKQISEIDTSKNGEIDYEDFLAMFTQPS